VASFYLHVVTQEDVDQFLGDVSVESALGAFNELYSKYKYMETSFERSKNVYKAKIPEIEQTLELIKLMIKKEEEDEEMVTNYNLCDTIYASAKVTGHFQTIRRRLFPK
jgi:hypothetical protein